MIEDAMLRSGNHRNEVRKRASSSPNHEVEEVDYYSAHLIGGRCYTSEDFESYHFKPNHNYNDDSSEKITEFERSYFGRGTSSNEEKVRNEERRKEESRRRIRRGRSQSPSFMNRHSTFSSDSDSCSSISNMMTDCLGGSNAGGGPETMTSSDSDDLEEVIYPEEQLKHVREFMTRRSMRLMAEELTRYPAEGRGCVCSNSMDSGYKSFRASPDVIDHHSLESGRAGSGRVESGRVESGSEKFKRQSARFIRHLNFMPEVSPFSHPRDLSQHHRCPVTTNQRLLARHKNNSLDNRLHSASHFCADLEGMGMYEEKIANRLRTQQMDAHLDHLLHLRRTLMTAIQRVESTSPRSSSPIVTTSRSTSPAVTVIARSMKTMTPSSSSSMSPNHHLISSPARSLSEVGVRPRRLLPTPGQRLHSRPGQRLHSRSPKPFHSPQLNDIRRVVQTSKFLEEEKSAASSETSSVTSSIESSSVANSNSISVHSSSDATFSSFPERQEFHTKEFERNVSLLNSMKATVAGNLIEQRQSFNSVIPRSETSGYSTGREDLEQVSDSFQEDTTSLSNTIPSHSTQSHTVPSHTTQSHTVPSHTTQPNTKANSSSRSGDFSEVSTLERNFKSLLSDEDDARLVVDLENFNPSKIPEALKMRPSSQELSSLSQPEVLKAKRGSEERKRAGKGRRSEEVGAGGETVQYSRVFKSPGRSEPKTLMDENGSSLLEKRKSGDEKCFSLLEKRKSGDEKCFSLLEKRKSGDEKCFKSRRREGEPFLAVGNPEGEKKQGSVSPRSPASGVTKERIRHPSSSSRESSREPTVRLEPMVRLEPTVRLESMVRLEPTVRLEPLTSATPNALMFKCAAAASISRHHNSGVTSLSNVTNSPKARTIVPTSSSLEKELLNPEDVDHRKLSPPHINAILDKHLRRKKSRSANSTPKKPSSEHHVDVAS